MLSLRSQLISRKLFRRQVLALLLSTGACLPALGDDSESSQPHVLSTTTLKIRSATRTWSDEGKPIAFQPSLRFRSPASDSESKRAVGQNLLAGNDSVVGVTAADEWMTNDNWVARDAVNLKQPLRDPLPPTAVVTPLQQPQLKKQAPAVTQEISTPPAIEKPSALGGSANSAPYETRRPTPPVKNPSPSAITHQRSESATLAPPSASSVATPDANDYVGDLNNGLLQLVPPSEVNELRSLDSPAEYHSIRVTDEPELGEPELGEPVGDLPNLKTERSRTTAVESILSGDSDGPDLNAPAGTEPADIEPTDTEATVRIEDESSNWDGESSLEDLDDTSLPLEGPEHTAEEPVADSESSRGGMEYRRLKIDRDGSPANASDRQLEVELPPLRESTNTLRDSQGDNEPLLKYLESSTPSLDAEETKRLQVLPIAQPKSDETVSPQGPLDYTGHPAGPMQVSTAVRRLQPMMRSCLSYYHGTPEEATGRSNWGMMHQIMVYGVDTNIKAGRNVHNAIAWIAGNNACRGQRILARGPRGLEAKSGVGLQGHQGQLLAVLSLSEVPENYPLYVATEKFYVRDLVREEMAICKSGEELTFTLIGLSHYLDTDQQWRSADGQLWNFERLIQEELSQPIVGAACGGTHRLMGFAHALRQRRAEGKEISGQWLRAEKFLDDFVTYTYQLQNRDGSMSTNWFEGREDNGDLDRKVQTTGHMVEWLLTFTPDEELQNPRLVAAIQFLLNAMNSDRKHDWQIGPKGHALRSLALYYERVYQSGPAWSRTPAVARSTNTTRR